MSPATAKTHVSRLLTKLDARDRAQLVMLAYETGSRVARGHLIVTSGVVLTGEPPDAYRDRVPASERFDAAYYRRYYGRHPVHDRRRIGQLAAGVLSLAQWWRIPIRSVLDIGAGKGFWRGTGWPLRHREWRTTGSTSASTHAAGTATNMPTSQRGGRVAGTTSSSARA